jgi:hypothetical protein
MMVGIDDVQFAHLRAPWLRPAAMIVPPAPAIATPRGRRIRRPDNPRDPVLAMLVAADVCIHAPSAPSPNS